MANANKRGIGLAQNPAEAVAKGRSWFVGIGINDYQHFSKLNNAVKDVEDVAALLQEAYGLEAAYCKKLYNREATRKNIIRLLDDLVRLIRPSDKLIIYYSGHGHLARSNSRQKGFWIPTDAEKDNTAHYLRNSTIRDYLEDIDSLHTLLISDACFSGSLFVRGASRSDEMIEELEKRPSRWAICSGRHDEEVFDGKPGRNSPFAESILDSLRDNQRPNLQVTKLVDRVVEQTRANYHQLPEGNPLFGVGHKGVQYVFKRQDVPIAPKIKPKVTPVQSTPVVTDPPSKPKKAQGEKLFESNVSHSSAPISTPRTWFSRQKKKVQWLIILISGIALASMAWLTYDIIVQQTITISYAQMKDSRDGETYKTISINSMTWLAENLRYGKVDQGQIWCYNGKEENCKKYGKLYTWEAAITACPDGWHLPTSKDWENLANAFGGYLWKGSYGIGNRSRAYQELFDYPNSSGFNAKNSGYRNLQGNFTSLRNVVYYWSATEATMTNRDQNQKSWCFLFSSSVRKLSRIKNDKGMGMSCRCVKN